MASWHHDRPLILELGEDEDRRERVERAEDDELLHVHAPVDERDEVALLRVQIETVEVREELGRQLRDCVLAFRMGQKFTDDRVADDLDVTAEREVVRVGETGLVQLLVGVPESVLPDRLGNEPGPVLFWG